jgi:hypothetical protein
MSFQIRAVHNKQTLESSYGFGQAFKASAALDPKPPESRELSYAKKKKHSPSHQTCGTCRKY